MAKTPGIVATTLFAWALWAGHPAMGQDPVDGVCDESVRNGCSAGNPNAAAYPDEPVVYQWRCDGLNGGRNSGRCALWFSVVGVCDESVRNGCAAGNPNDDAFPDSPTMYAWRCDGLNAGANSGRCHIRVADVVDGACDDSVRNGCSAGTANDDAIPDNASTYLWRCDGLRGGRNSDKCHIRVADVVDGVCDDTVRNGCSAGTPNDDAIPDNASTYLWRCDGLRGGRNSDKCHIRVADVVDGACDDGVRNGCSAGTPNDDAIPDNASTYLWRCDGLRGGANSDKCHIRVADVVDGVCDDTVRNGCSAGTANDDAIPDNQHTYLWRCDGLRGGADSEKCFIRVADVPVDGVCDDTVRNGCSAGTANDDAFADNSTGYLWRCDGLHGGRNSDKCFIRVQDVPVDGVCDESVRDGCSAGTANDIAVADTTSHYRWRCDGEHGGANSGTCSTARAAVDGGWSAWGACSATACGAGGTQTRTCSNPSPAHGGQACLKLDGSRGASETRACTGNAPVNGGWSAWSACSATACGGSGTQTRTCNNPSPACGGAACTGPSSQTCTGSGPVWSAWSACSTNVCGEQGTQTRTCNTACGGNCSGPATRTCTGNAPRDGVWRTGAWDGWGNCQLSGGSCNESRSRTVSCHQPGCGGAACPESSKPSPTDTRPCTSSCSATTLSWSSGNTSCSGPVSAASGGSSANASNTASCRTGSATFPCSCAGNWGSATSSSCTASPPVNGVCSTTGCSAGERDDLAGGGWRCEGSCGGTTTSRCPVSCPATTLSWGSGCSGPVSQTPAGSSATPQNNIDCRSGSATFPCNYDRTWGDPTNASCTALPPVNGACSATGCSAGRRYNLSGGRWQCRGSCGGTTAGPVNGVCSTTGCSAGAKRNLSGGGWECEGSCGGTTTSRCPVSCPATTLGWGSGCSGPVSQTPAGSSATPQNNIDCRSGSATFPCNYDRTWGDPTNASCTALPPVNGACSATGCSAGERDDLAGGGWRCEGSCGGTTTSRCPVSCPATTLSWGSGCSGPVSQTPAGSSATPQNNIDCRSGSATFPCNYDRTWGDPTNASCTALPPVNGACSATGCSTGEKRTLSSGGWQCVGSCGGTTEGPVNGVWRTGDWGAWGTCQFQTSSRRCEQSRSRTVTCDPPSCGGAACAPASKPAATATQACQNEQTCPSECRNGVRWDPVLRRYVRCS